MGKVKIGVQVYSVRDFAEKDFKGTVEKIKAMGYDGLELAGLYDLTASEVKEIVDNAGITVISAHVPYQQLLMDMEGTIADYKEIGCRYIAIPYLEEELRPGSQGFAEVMDNLIKIGQICKGNGMTLLYHNHDFEFKKMEDGRYALDYLYDTIPADLLQTEIDTCWVNVAGEDPSAYIDKYTGRAPIVHIKDFYMERGDSTGKLYDLIGIEDDTVEEMKSTFEFRTVGNGLQDVKSIVEHSIAAGADWVIVEQDQSYDTPSIENIETSIKYLRSIGY